MRATVTHVRSRGEALSMCGRLTTPNGASVPLEFRRGYLAERGP